MFTSCWFNRMTPTFLPGRPQNVMICVEWGEIGLINTLALFLQGDKKAFNVCLSANLLWIRAAWILSTCLSITEKLSSARISAVGNFQGFDLFHLILRRLHSCSSSYVRFCQKSSVQLSEWIHGPTTEQTGEMRVPWIVWEFWLLMLLLMRKIHLSQNWFHNLCGP